jgi:hypothetical protein
MLAAAASCGGRATASRPSALIVVSGNNQTGVVGQELPKPVSVRVTDAAGRPVQGQLVSFHVVAGGGSVFAGAANSNPDGLALERWTLGRRAGDPQRLEARAVDASTGAAIVFGTFDAVAVAGPAVSIGFDGDLQTGFPDKPLAAPIGVQVSDVFGNGVAGVMVTFVAAAGSGSANPQTATTDLSGESRAQWTLGPTARQQTLQALAAGFPAHTFVANPGQVFAGPFAGIYVGAQTYSQCDAGCSDTVSFMVTDGGVDPAPPPWTTPGIYAGGVSNDGSVSYYRWTHLFFGGTFVADGGSVTGSGGFQCTDRPCSGTWNVSRQ